MCSMNLLEVVPGRDIGKLHVLKKVGNLDGEECFLCRDEKGRNIQFVESEIIAQAGEGLEVVAEEVVEETPPADEDQDNEETPPDGEPEEEVPGGASVEMTEETTEESVLESLMSKPIEDLEGQEIVTILIGVYGDNPPDDLTVEELRHRLEIAGKPEDPEEGESKENSEEKSEEEKKEAPKTSILKKVANAVTGKDKKGGK